MAGSFYSQIEQAMQRSQLIIFVVCGAIALLMLLAAVWLAILFAIAPDRADRRPDGRPPSGCAAAT